MTTLMIAIALIAMFQLAVWRRWLGRDSGSRLIDHSTLILLIALPSPPDCWRAWPQGYLFALGLVWFWRVAGAVCFIDDCWNHWVIGQGQRWEREHGGDPDARMYYHSPIHRLGTAMRGNLKATIIISCWVHFSWLILAGIAVEVMKP